MLPWQDARADWLRSEGTKSFCNAIPAASPQVHLVSENLVHCLLHSPRSVLWYHAGRDTSGTQACLKLMRSGLPWSGLASRQLATASASSFSLSQVGCGCCQQGLHFLQGLWSGRFPRYHHYVSRSTLACISGTFRASKILPTTRVVVTLYLPGTLVGPRRGSSQSAAHSNRTTLQFAIVPAIICGGGFAFGFMLKQFPRTCIHLSYSNCFILTRCAPWYTFSVDRASHAMCAGAPLHATACPHGANQPSLKLSIAAAASQLPDRWIGSVLESSYVISGCTALWSLRSPLAVGKTVVLLVMCCNSGHSCHVWGQQWHARSWMIWTAKCFIMDLFCRSCFQIPLVSYQFSFGRDRGRAAACLTLHALSSWFLLSVWL